VKLRAGQLSYKEDPMGWRSFSAQTITHGNEARSFKVSLPYWFLSRAAWRLSYAGSMAHGDESW